MADKVAGRMAPDAIKMALVHRVQHGEAQEVHEVEVTRFETMASCLLVGHANGAMFDPWHGPGRVPGVPTWFPRTAGPAPESGAHTADVPDEPGLGAEAAHGSASPRSCRARQHISSGRRAVSAADAVCPHLN
jgi:hypothetical protein